MYHVINAVLSENKLVSFCITWKMYTYFFGVTTSLLTSLPKRERRKEKEEKRKKKRERAKEKEQKRKNKGKRTTNPLRLYSIRKYCIQVIMYGICK